MQSVNQGGIKYYFLSLWYDSIWDWTQTSQAIAEHYNKSNVKLGGVRSQLQASYVSSHIEELWYNEIVCLWMTIYK